MIYASLAALVALYVLYPIALLWGMPISGEHKRAATASMLRAFASWVPKLLVGLTAPLVVWLPLLWTARDAYRLPGFWNVLYGNNASINGDNFPWVELPVAQDRGYDLQGVANDGGWYWQIPDPREPLEKRIARCYWLPTWLPAWMRDPNRWLARYVWLGWRNRSSLLAVQSGRAWPDAPREVVAGDPLTDRNHEGFVLRRCGDLYQFYRIQRLGGRALRTNCGYKIQSEQDTSFSKAPPVYISISCPSWSGTE